MTQRITKQMLENSLELLNANEKYYKAFYEIEYMYGKCRLVRYNSHERREVISELGSKRELYYITKAIRTIQLCYAIENTTF